MVPHQDTTNLILQIVLQHKKKKFLKHRLQAIFLKLNKTNQICPARFISHYWVALWPTEMSYCSRQCTTNQVTKSEKPKSYTNSFLHDPVAVTGSHPEKHHFFFCKREAGGGISRNPECYIKQVNKRDKLDRKDEVETV